ncbi:unnamed protein product [Kuraishia capsulata CBS 1993]|uniref:Dolichyl-diphosphooligosaccharide--protein glycosyltransferase subunit WBP1 n=1 Tax=Kuraishia capsulata CBS 1993 TaxID=1382522 RepID=W6MN62_9ASCO|nr:uncharacterized protein KUCA_T00002444001 [Kuraishia capsulata CBS 1993]CDK26472.1 unnamed protein product [Kuraishia capsulata CBS 1993]
MRLSLVLALIFNLAALVFAGPAVKGATLVIYDPKLSKLSDYDNFVKSLDDVKAVEIGSSDIALFINGIRMFENLVILPSKVRSISPHVGVKELVEYVNDGGNLFGVTSSAGAQLDLEKFLGEVGIYTNAKFKLFDHFNEDSTKEGSVLIKDPEFQNKIVVPSSVDQISYSGSAALLSNSEYLIPILKAPKTSYTYNAAIGPVGSDSVWTSGDQGYLIVSFQALNNARVTWLGDDNLIKDSKYDNLAKDLVSWTFQYRGVIKSVSTSHENVVTGLESYKVKDFAKYEIEISQWSSEENTWVPFEADDVQVEFIMLDPYQRVNANVTSSDEEKTLFTAVFQIPDQHGMFTFSVDYKRPGLSFIDEKIVVPVRHLANDEYPRSWEITNSWVYLTSAVAVIIVWFAFVTVFIFSGKAPLVEDGKKKN